MSSTFKSDNNETRLESLLREVNENRTESYEILSRIKSFRDKIDVLIPSTNDFKYRKLIEDKMKLFTEIIKTELDVRKSIDNSIRMESDLVRKLDEKRDESGTIISNDDIRKILTEMDEIKTQMEN